MCYEGEDQVGVAYTLFHYVEVSLGVNLMEIPFRLRLLMVIDEVKQIHFLRQCIHSPCSL